ncbi:MAG: hypothetical protein QXN08_01175 [Nitrososphaerales archaeon]
MVYAELVHKYIEVMRSNPTLKDVAAYHFGIPFTAYRYPLIYVQWLGKEYSGRSDLHRFQYILRFEIGVIERHASEDEAEKTIYRLIEGVEEALNSNPTLDGLVENEPEPRVIEVARGSEQDYALAWARIIDLKKVWTPYA